MTNPEHDSPWHNRVRKVVINHAAKWLCFWLLFYPGVAVAAIFLGGGWPLVLETDFRTYIRSDTAASTEYDALQSAKSAGDVKPAPTSRRALEEWAWDDSGRELGHSATRTIQRWDIVVFYRTQDGSNIFTPENLAAIKAVEDALQALPGWEIFCSAPSNEEESNYALVNLQLKTCGQMAPQRDSVLNYFYGQEVDPASVPGSGQAQNYIVYNGAGKNGQGELRDIDTVIDELLLSPIGATYANAQFSALNRVTNVTRSKFTFSGPVVGFDNAYVDSNTQQDLFYKFLADEVYPALQLSSGELVRVVWWNDYLSSLEVTEAVIHDGIISVGSCVFTFVFMVYHLQSFFLAAIALIGILYSFPAGIHVLHGRVWLQNHDAAQLPQSLYHHGHWCR